MLRSAQRHFARTAVFVPGTALAEVGRLGRIRGSNALKMLRGHPQGRHYRAIRSRLRASFFGNGQVATPFALHAANLQPQEMVARHCSQIVREENSLGRHYSHFWPILDIGHKQYQLLVRSSDGENRPNGRESANFG